MIPAPEELRAALMGWYAANGRHLLPWRLTRDPYAVLVSEIMLQQTQVDRVLPYYVAWLGRWPDFASLAAASPASVIEHWAGLGYNRRALNLHRLAVEVVELHDGALPADTAALRALPGIGPYTAGAVRCFARGETVAVADTNIARVLARLLLGLASQRDVSPLAVDEVATAFLPAGGGREHNLALMDLGALLCKARDPDCESCPLAAGCSWRIAGARAAERARAPQPKFQETARFARGRIVETLRRTEALPASVIAERLPPRHAERIAEYLFALSHDGLVEQLDDGRWALPGRAQGRMSIASPKL